jgi:hypothetical protein
MEVVVAVRGSSQICVTQLDRRTKFPPNANHCVSVPSYAVTGTHIDCSQVKACEDILTKEALKSLTIARFSDYSSFGGTLAPSGEPDNSAFGTL